MHKGNEARMHKVKTRQVGKEAIGIQGKEA